MDFFKLSHFIPIDDPIIKMAIDLKQQKSMSLSDAIIAACALCENLPLLTAHTQDFKHLSKIELIDVKSLA